VVKVYVVELENKKGISVFSMTPCWLNRPVRGYIDYNAKEIFPMLRLLLELNLNF
jgi:hypothetical protein